MSSVKVLEVISDSNIGGAGIHLMNYIMHRDTSAFDFYVVLPKDSLLKERLDGTGVRVFEIDAMVNRSVDLKAISKLKKVIKAVDPDIVHTHGSMSGRIAGKICGKKVVFTRHTAFPMDMPKKTGLKRAAYRFLTRRYADRIIAVGQPCKEGLEKCGVPSDMIDVLINGCDPAVFPPAEESARLKDTLGIMPGQFVFGIIARLEDYKGHRHVLEAAKRLKDQGRVCRIVIAGTGGVENKLRAMAKELGVEDSVIFMGFVSDVPGLLSILDVQLNASYLETSSLSLIEGFSAGVPAIASDCGGNLLLVDNGVNGLLFKMGSSDDLAEKMALLMDERALLKTLGDGACTAYKEKFTGEVFARAVEQTYKRVLEDR